VNVGLSKSKLIGAERDETQYKEMIYAGEKWEKVLITNIWWIT